MTVDERIPRLLGAMFLVVVVTSLAQGLPLMSVAGSNSATDVMLHAAENVGFMRVGVVAGVLTSAGIIALAALLYAVLRGQSEVLALLALGLWLAEGLFNGISQVGAAALIPLSMNFVDAGAPADSHFQALAQFVYFGVDQLSYTIHMFFYCMGGIIWYSLFLRSRSMPFVIPLFGLAAVVVGLVGIVLELLGNEVSTLAYLPILPFELTIGAWLVLRGAQATPAMSTARTRGAIGSS